MLICVCTGVCRHDFALDSSPGSSINIGLLAIVELTERFHILFYLQTFTIAGSIMIFKTFTFLGIASVVIAHGSHDQEPIEGPHQSLWYNTLPGDGGTQVRTHMSSV
jgi:hypothetical protein